MGTCAISKVPLDAVLAFRDSAESAAAIVTDALAMGRCWASCTTPRIVAKTVARPGAEHTMREMIASIWGRRMRERPRRRVQRESAKQRVVYREAWDGLVR